MRKLGPLGALTLLLAGACATAPVPLVMELQPVELPVVLTPGEEHLVVFDLVNKGPNPADVCVVGRLSFMVWYPNNEKIAVLLPYFGNTTDGGCDHKVGLQPGEAKRYSLSLTLIRTASPGEATVRGGMTVTDQQGRTWQFLAAPEWAVTVKSAEGRAAAFTIPDQPPNHSLQPTTTRHSNFGKL